MPFSFKFLAMTAIATLLFQATTASEYFCKVEPGTYTYWGFIPGIPGVYGVGFYRSEPDATKLEATMTTDFCENGQHFSFDATNGGTENCGCVDPAWCPLNFAHSSVSGGGICYDNAAAARAGTGACGTWCTRSITNNASPYAGCAANTYQICSFPTLGVVQEFQGGSDNGQEATAEPPAAAASGSDDAGSNDSSDAEIALTVFEGGIFACLLFIAYTYGTRKASAAEAQPDDRRPAYDQRGFVGVGVGSVASVSEL